MGTIFRKGRMSIRLTHFPHFVPKDEYENAIERMATAVSKNKAVVAIYQVGGVGHPGISDIDLVVVVADNQSITEAFIDGISEGDRYLFTHSLFGISVTHFQQLQQYSLYHNYQLIFGEDVLKGIPGVEGEVETVLKRQIAMEFLVNNYLVRSVEYAYGLFSMRSLLLSVNAIKYDLEFLNITSGELYEMVWQLVGWRGNWFDNPPEKSEILKWLAGFMHALEYTIEEQSAIRPIHLPRDHGKLGKHISWRAGNELLLRRSGITLPGKLLLPVKIWKKLMHRVNDFQFELPVDSGRDSTFLVARAEYYRALKSYNQEYLPKLAPPGNSLLLSVV